MQVLNQYTKTPPPSVGVIKFSAWRFMYRSLWPCPFRRPFSFVQNRPKMHNLGTSLAKFSGLPKNSAQSAKKKILTFGEVPGPRPASAQTPLPPPLQSRKPKDLQTRRPPHIEPWPGLTCRGEGGQRCSFALRGQEPATGANREQPAPRQQGWGGGWQRRTLPLPLQREALEVQLRHRDPQPRGHRGVGLGVPRWAAALGPLAEGVEGHGVRQAGGGVAVPRGGPQVPRQREGGLPGEGGGGGGGRRWQASRGSARTPDPCHAQPFQQAWSAGTA